MPANELKTCPRCGTCFECKAGNISLCQCNDVDLSEAVKIVMEKQFHDCLCLQCLKQLQQEVVTEE